MQSLPMCLTDGNYWLCRLLAVTTAGDVHISQRSNTLCSRKDQFCLELGFIRLLSKVIPCTSGFRICVLETKTAMVSNNERLASILGWPVGLFMRRNQVS